jgi:exopolyphosphatase/guanosine-5'-triphosphate,3'-diphosphate pyrophosphatase
MSPVNPETLAAAERLADRYDAERAHRQQVRRLSLQLFDQLAGLLKLDEMDRFVLECAAILHDIGWCLGQQGHHKQSMKMILEDTTIPLTPSERVWVALTARYHRKALPKKEHPVFGTLGPEEQKRVETLAGILRIADGLDSSHQNWIDSLRVEVKDRCLIVRCRSRTEAEEELEAARKKADLLGHTMGFSIHILREQ